jgi:hypothetical protein
MGVPHDFKSCTITIIGSISYGDVIDGIEEYLALHRYHSHNGVVKEQCILFHSLLQILFSENVHTLGEPFGGEN